MENDELFEIPKEYLGNKRREEDYISKESSAMATAISQALMSKDPSTQVGACFLDKDGNIMSCGYNSPPKGWPDEEFTWDKPKEEEFNKYTYIVHAEMNALFNYNGSIKDFKGSTAFVTFLPCPNCAKHLVQAGVKDVVYLAENNDNAFSKLSSSITKYIFKKCKVGFRKFDSINEDNINIMVFKMKTEDEKDLAFFEKKKKLNLKKDNNQ